jgi:uncharacterized protein YcfJ
MSIHPTRLMLAFSLLGISAAASAAEYGTVVSATPITAAVPIPMQECRDQPVVFQRPTSGAGALIGGIAGAAIGNSVGAGAGRALATGIGLMAGSAIGNQVEANGTPPVSSTVRECRNATRYENRTIGYDVVYEYQSVRRHTRTANDPGDRIALNVNVAPVESAPPQAAYVPQQPEGYAPPAQATYVPPPVYYAPQSPVVVAAPYVYGPRFAPNPWPVVSIGVGYGWGWHGGHRR